MSETMTTPESGRTLLPVIDRPPSVATRAWLGARSVLRATFGGRSRREFLFCLAGIPIGLSVPLLALAVEGIVAGVAFFAHGIGADQPATALSAVLTGLLLLALLSRQVPGLAFRIGGLQRRLAAGLLGITVIAPIRRPRRPGWRGRLGAGWRDGPGWRAAGYLLLKLLLAAVGCYLLAVFVIGVVDLSYPFWWPLFRNHPAGVTLSPVDVFTPSGIVKINSWPATLGAAANGLGLTFAASWLIRGLNALDLRLVRSLLGAPASEQRIQDLERTRAYAVDDTAELLRRVERNLHDGAQMRLTALAVNLGRTRDRLGADGEPVAAADLAQARELVDAAHAGAKEALAELRVLARGLHPPVLDNGLPDALATLVAQSPVPARLVAELPGRPSPAIETIVYFCAAELLTNTAKHSRAGAVAVRLVETGGRVRLEVEDDGVGGADPARGTGLTGLRDRLRTVDGTLDVASPPGGPTRIRVELPVRAVGT